MASVSYLVSIVAIFAAASHLPAGPLARNASEGTLCLSARTDLPWPPDAGCAPTTAKVVRLRPAQNERVFLWIRHGGAELLAGLVPAGAASLAISHKVSGAASFLLEGAAARGWPQAVTFLVERPESGKSWRWTVPAGAVGRVRDLRLPLGSYRLTLTAPRHQALYRDAVSIRAGERAFKLGTLRLAPSPVIRGRVVDQAAREPVAGAMVMLADQRTLAATDRQGDFEAELPGGPVPFVTILASGFGSRTVAVHGAAAPDIDLGTILLYRRGTLRVRVVRPDSEPPDAIEISLLRDPRNRRSRRRITTSRLGPAEHLVELPDLEPGPYALLIRGASPLERLLVPVEVKSAAVTEKRVKITPVDLEGHLFFGDQPFPDAMIELKAEDGVWQARVQTDGQGDFGGALWQQGDFAAIVTGEPLREPYATMKSLQGGDRIVWDFAVPDRRVFGRVYDTRAHSAIPGAVVSIESNGEGVHFSFDTTSDRDGNYEFTAVHPGRITLRAEARDYLSSDPISFALTAADRSREIGIRLERGVALPVQIVDSSAAPIPNAVVVDGLAPGGFEPLRVLTADAGGRLTVPLPAEQGQTLYVIPSSGSFAVLRVDATMRREDGEPVPLVVPAGDGYLLIRAESVSGDPLPDVQFLLRFNGALLPPGVLRLAASIQGFSPSTGPDGQTLLPRFPAGLYELWPYATPYEAMGLLSGIGSTQAPVQAGVSAGRYTVTLKFNPRQR